MTGTGTCTVTADQNGNANYNAAPQATQTFTVGKKAITITPDSGQSKVYGATDPTLTYTTSAALKSGDSFTGALARVAGENAGSYAITLGDLAASSNYNVTLS